RRRSWHPDSVGLLLRPRHARQRGACLSPARDGSGDGVGDTGTCGPARQPDHRQHRRGYQCGTAVAEGGPWHTRQGGGDRGSRPGRGEVTGRHLVTTVPLGRPGTLEEGGNPMDITRITVEHVRVVADNKPFDELTRAFEEQLGRFDATVYQSLSAGADADNIRARLEKMVGPSGFMLFQTSDHGALLSLAGQKTRAIQYLVGNPLFAIQMTQHDIRAGLYAPLRVLIYENDQGKTCIEYDKPSSLFGQFGNAKVTAVADMLDQKLEKLVAKAVQ